MHEREEIEYTGKNCKFTDGEKADITKTSSDKVRTG